MEELESEEKESGRSFDRAGKPSRLPPPQPDSGNIAIDDFAKVDLRVGQVVSAERVKGADKLLHLKVDIGEPEPRTLWLGSPKPTRPRAAGPQSGDRR